MRLLKLAFKSVVWTTWLAATLLILRMDRTHKRKAAK
jgi:hypothetical protein